MWRLYCNLLLLPTEVTHGTPTHSTSWLPVANRTVPISDDPSMCSVTCMRLNCLSIFKGHFSRGPGLVGTRMFPFWILLELRVVEVMVTTGAMRSAKLQSNHHHQQTNTQLFTGRISFLSPNQQCQSTKGKDSSTNSYSTCVHHSAQYKQTIQQTSQYQYRYEEDIRHSPVNYQLAYFKLLINYQSTVLKHAFNQQTQFQSRQYNN